MPKVHVLEEKTSKLNKNKVDSQVKESIQILRDEVYPKLTDEELKHFNNRLSKFLFY